MYGTQDNTAKGDSDFRSISSDTLIMEALQTMVNITIPVRRERCLQYWSSSLNNSVHKNIIHIGNILEP